jgi:multiple sugar transport system permease protein
MGRPQGVVMHAARRRLGASRRGGVLQRREALAGYLFTAPWTLGLLLFIVGPIIASLVISLTDWAGINAPNWVGLANYAQMFGNDPLFWQSLKVTVLFTLFSVPLGLALGLLMAILLNQKVRGLSWFRTIYYLPSVVPPVAASMLWLWMFDPNFGLLNQFLGFLGIPGPGWLADEQWALPAMVVMSLWGVGGGMLIYLAGLQGIPSELYEAARIDGANWWTLFWRITLPLLSPVMFFNLITGVIGSFQFFTQSYVMTQGGPHYATEFYALYLFQQAFTYFHMGYASALAWVLFLIVLALTLIVLRSATWWVYYQGEET